VQSNLRRPERWRGRVRGQTVAWSVLPVAVVVIVLGGMFWASMWMILHTPSSRAVTSTDLTGTATPVANDHDGTDEGVVAAVDAPVTSDEDEQADDDDDLDAFDTPAMQAEPADDEDTDASVMTDEQAAARPASADPTVDGVEVAMGPLFGPAEPEGFVEVAGAIASADAGGDQGTAMAETLTARAEDLTTKAEALTAKIEGLTTKIDDLQTKLDASAAALAAVPSPVAVPTPGATPRPTSATTAVARAGRTPTTGRSPWVVMPQPGPGSHVTAGPLVLETRARGEAPITEIRLVLDGVPLTVALEKRDDSTWRGRASTQVRPGSHTVAVAVIDGQGRTGSYKWQFDAGS
jgi:hypothetical protein